MADRPFPGFTAPPPAPPVDLPNPEPGMTLREQFAFDPLGTLLSGVRGAVVGGADTQAGRLGALLGAVAPILPFNKVRSVLGAAKEAEVAAEGASAGSTLVDQAKALYRQRGHGGAGSISGMAQALKDSGHTFGPMKTAAQRREANTFVQQLVQEADAAHAARTVPESPFAQRILSGTDTAAPAVRPSATQELRAQKLQQLMRATPEEAERLRGQIAFLDRPGTVPESKK